MPGQGSYGAKFEYSSDGVTYTEVGDLVDMEAPEFDHMFFEDRYLNQANRSTAKVGTFYNLGSATFTTSYTYTKYTLLAGLIDDPDPYYWRITLPLMGAQASYGDRIAFRGLLKSLPMPFPEDGGRIVMSPTIECSGAVTLTAGV